LLIIKLYTIYDENCYKLINKVIYGGNTHYSYIDENASLLLILNENNLYG